MAGKDDLSRTWDVHAERVVGCTDCHYSLNNPAYATEPGESRPDHLIFDPRRLEPGEYLTRPLHELARSDADVVTEGTCQSCHEVKSTHSWLPYTDRHMDEVACESCHVARLETPARQSVDWTVLTATGAPQVTCRGNEPDGSADQMIVVGYEPALLPRDEGDGTTSFAPYILITPWYWAYGADARPVSLADLQAAYFDGGAYHPDVLLAFDADGNSLLDDAELMIDTDPKEALIAGRLAALGLDNPRIVAQAEAYPINHSVTHGDYATRDCRICHGSDSRLAQPFELAGSAPGGVLPTFDGSPVSQDGDIVVGDDGKLIFQPSMGTEGTSPYIFGYSRSKLVDWVGMLIFLSVMVGVTVHGGIRYVAAQRRVPHEPDLREVYMYSVYERLWHWLQTGAILLLAFTGLIIHKPDMFGMFSFRGVVQVHNILSAILIVNAVLAAFYHFASGEIKQYLPKPRGFFSQGIEQAMFYLNGIFKGEAHPIEKTPQRKLNPLQQVTYLGILNGLLPAQIITGALMWGVQRWPQLASSLGGLALLAPLHTLVAWLFVSFIVAHVYLTTTGPKPLASINGMIMGWDQVESHAGAD
jgi:thiosulfate reductase cytochrome b subunit